MVRILDCSDLDERPAHVKTTAIALRRGGIAVVPDETLYTIVGDAFSQRATTSIRDVKGRSDAPLSVLVGYHHTVDGIASQIPNFARDLMDAFWPGPLSLILRQQPSLTWGLRAPGVTVRMPLHPIAIAVVREIGPTAATAANRAGLPAALGIHEAAVQFDDDVDIFLDAGPMADGLRTTVIDCTGSVPVIVRAGPLEADRIAAVCPALEVASGIT